MVIFHSYVKLPEGTIPVEVATEKCRANYPKQGSDQGPVIDFLLHDLPYGGKALAKSSTT